MAVHKMCIGLAIAVAIATALICAGGPGHADSRSANEKLAQTIDQIAAEQKAIREDLAVIKEQLRILTIRVTQQQ